MHPISTITLTHRRLFTISHLLRHRPNNLIMRVRVNSPKSKHHDTDRYHIRINMRHIPLQVTNNQKTKPRSPLRTFLRRNTRRRPHPALMLILPNLHTKSRYLPTRHRIITLITTRRRRSHIQAFITSSQANAKLPIRRNQVNRPNTITPSKYRIRRPKINGLHHRLLASRNQRQITRSRSLRQVNHHKHHS